MLSLIHISFDAAVAARAYGYDEDDIISSGEFLANFFPLFYVGKGNWDYAVQNLAKFMIYKGYHTGEISAACGFVAALAACFHNDEMCIRDRYLWGQCAHL